MNHNLIQGSGVMVSQFIMFHTLNWVDCSHKIYIREEEIQRNKISRMFLNVSSLVFTFLFPACSIFSSLCFWVEWHESRSPCVLKKRWKGLILRTTQGGLFLVPTVPIVASNVGPSPPKKKQHHFSVIKYGDEMSQGHEIFGSRNLSFPQYFMWMSDKRGFCCSMLDASGVLLIQSLNGTEPTASLCLEARQEFLEVVPGSATEATAFL